MIEQLLQNSEHQFQQRLNAALTDTLPIPMPTLLGVHSSTVRFASSIRQALHMTPSETLLLAVMASIYQPLEAVLPRYKELEKHQLSHEIDAMGLSVLSVDDADTVLSVVKSTVPKAFGLLEGAVQRCMQLSGGSLLAELQSVVDNTAVHYLDVLQRLVHQLSRRYVCWRVGSVSGVVYTTWYHYLHANHSRCGLSIHVHGHTYTYIHGHRFVDAGSGDAATPAGEHVADVSDQINNVLPLLNIARMYTTVTCTTCCCCLH